MRSRRIPKVLVEGSRANFIRFVRYHKAQEEANTNWAGSTTVVWRIFKEKWTLSGSPAPEIHLRLTEIPLMVHGGSRFTGSSYPTRISLTDCHISSENLFSTAPTPDLTIEITNSSFCPRGPEYGLRQWPHDDSLRPQQPFQFLLPEVESGNREQVGVAG